MLCSGLVYYLALISLLLWPVYSPISCSNKPWTCWLRPLHTTAAWTRSSCHSSAHFGEAFTGTHCSVRSSPPALLANTVVALSSFPVWYLHSLLFSAVRIWARGFQALDLLSKEWKTGLMLIFARSKIILLGVKGQIQERYKFYCKPRQWRYSEAPDCIQPFFSLHGV